MAAAQGSVLLFQITGRHWRQEIATGTVWTESGYSTVQTIQHEQSQKDNSTGTMWGAATPARTCPGLCKVLLLRQQGHARRAAVDCCRRRHRRDDNGKGLQHRQTHNTSEAPTRFQAGAGVLSHKPGRKNTWAAPSECLLCAGAAPNSEPNSETSIVFLRYIGLEPPGLFIAFAKDVTYAQATCVREPGAAARQKDV